MVKPCFVNVTHSEKDGKTYANLANVTAMMKGVPVPPLAEDTQIFSFDSDNPNLNDFENLPEWVRNMIKKSINWEDILSKLDQGTGLISETDLPF
jgi:hypothetical protein